MRKTPARCAVRKIKGMEEHDNLAREQRLLELRREAELAAGCKGGGIRPAGAPFPMASPETGYYGIPLLKEPSWTWEIPLYFFVGGAAGAAAVVGAIADYTGADESWCAMRDGLRRQDP